MPGLQRRSRTSYDVYRDYNTDDILNDNYPADGAASPRQDGADTPAQYGRATPDWRYTPVPDRYTPANGHMTPPPSRPKSGSIRPLGRPPSRNDAGIQQADTQRSYTMQDSVMRPTSPVQRILDRSNTQPFMSMQGPMPGSQMDPITRQYYHRKWSARTPSSTDITLNRYGRAGGVWRHVRSCVANTGTQIAFIDGIVKEEDNVFFPQFPNTSPYQNAPAYLTARLPVRKQRTPAKKTTTYATASNRRAKQGFEYWFKEPKPVDSSKGDFVWPTPVLKPTPGYAERYFQLTLDPWN